METSKTLQRQFKRHISRENGEQLLTGFLSGSVPQTDVNALVASLPAFFDAVNQAYVDYDDKIKLSSRSLEISSLELNDSNRQLEELISSINAMLNGLGQGLLFFDRDGMCSNVYSKICVDLFEGSPENRKIQDILKLSGQEQQDFETWREVVFEASLAMPIEDFSDLAPQFYKNNNGQSLRLEYRAIKDKKGAMTAILLIASDITRELQDQAAKEAVEHKAASIVAIANSRNNFIQFMIEMQAFLNEEFCNGAALESRRLKSRLHTYKGLAGAFHLDMLAHSLHALEQHMTGVGSIICADIVAEAEKSRSLLADALITGQEILGENFLALGDVRTVSMDSLAKFRDMLAQDQKAAMLYFETEIYLCPVEDALKPVTTEILRLCASQEKPAPQISFVGGETRIDTQRYKYLLESLIHIARNIADHGLEHPMERIHAGKKPEGSVTITATPGVEGLTLSFTDDGAGIDPVRLAESIRAKGIDIPAESSHEQILHMIFLPAVSTRTEATMISGRGIGLSAVEEEAQRLGGHVSVESTVGVGTTLTISVP